MCAPSNAGLLAGFLLLVATVCCHKGFAAAGIAAALLLLAIDRAWRELLVAAGLLGVTYHGLSQLLETIKTSDPSPAKASVMVAVILAWTALAALGLGRLLGRREED